MTMRVELIRCSECRATAPADEWDISADYDDGWHGESICPVCRADNGGAPEEIVVRVTGGER